MSTQTAIPASDPVVTAADLVAYFRSKRGGLTFTGGYPLEGFLIVTFDDLAKPQAVITFEEKDRFDKIAEEASRASLAAKQKD